MLLWGKIKNVMMPSDSELELAGILSDEIKNGTILKRTQSSLINISDGTVSALYAELEKTSRPAAPMRLETDSSWMIDTDIAWMHIGAAATDAMPGTFIRAAKILPAITSKAILLAPFHPNQFDLTYAPQTMTLVDPAFTDPRLTERGISRENQARAFVSACRLLGKSVGYELLPYASQFSRIAMEMPRLFRWVALDESRTGLAQADELFPYTRGDRLRDAETVSEMTAAAKETYGVSSFRTMETDSEAVAAAKEKAYFAAIKLCIENGLWPVPAHARKGLGIPAFHKYDGAGDFPVFAYRDADGRDVSADAYSVVAPFAFYDDMPINQAPSGTLPENDEAIRYYSNIFSYWRDCFDFDFVRYNAVDRIFNETLPGNNAVPVSDRPTPSIVQAAIAASRTPTSGTGAVSSHKGTETELYSSLGFDLTMGTEPLRRVDDIFMQDMFALYDALSSRHESLKPVSVCFAVDVPESAAPMLWGAPLPKVMGPERMRLRHALARFISVGKGRRPMFETMGFQDGSTGLYEAGLERRGLTWTDSKENAAAYAAIEALFAELKPFMRGAAIHERQVETSHAWWQIRDAQRQRLVIVAISLETSDGQAPGTITVPVDAAWGTLSGTVRRLPFASAAPLEVSEKALFTLAPIDCVVIDLTPSGMR